MSESPKGMTDTDIVCGLRSDDPEKRRKALDAVFNDRNGSFGAVLVTAGAMTSQMSSTTTLDAGRLFNALLYVQQQLGASLGLALGWVPTAPPAGGLIVPR